MAGTPPRPLRMLAQCRHTRARLCSRQRRSIQISSSPTSQDSTLDVNVADTARSTEGPDAQFEVLGHTSSLLSASISASQALYTRRGTLVGFAGDAETTTSKLSVLEPLRRLAGGIPFLYQKIISTTPISVLIAAKSAATSYSIIQLDGRLDWMVAQRNALLAWTGQTLSLRPHVSMSMGLAHWGRTSVTGRGLLCLAGKGNVYQVTLKTGEEYIIHPSNILAYAMMRNTPQPYRFKSSTVRLQIPSLSSLLPDTRFFNSVRTSTAWTFTANLLFTIRTWFRRSVLGDRLFLRFQGPAQILVQSRGNSITESLSGRDVNEIADSPAGDALARLPGAGPVGAKARVDAARPVPATAVARPTTTMYATVKRDGHVEFEKS